MHKKRASILYLLPCAALLWVQSVLAVDYKFSGYGTIGYAQSDQPYNYQRYISKSGTFMRDSVFGAQLDAKFTPEWSATVQAKVAPSIVSDTSWTSSISWAFLSYRPSNSLLVRAGKLRMPFYLYAENMDVGATYSQARMPNELYSLAPTMDSTGATFVKTWDVGDNEINLDGYWGQATMPWRFYSRDTATPSWMSLNAIVKGVLLSLHRQEDIYRIGVHTADFTRNDGNPFYVNLTTNTLSPFSGMSGTYYTPPAASQKTGSISAPTINLGFDVGWARGFRTVGEYVRSAVQGMDIGPDTESYYFTLMKEVDLWTPYVTYAQIKSKNLAVYQAVNGARVSSLGVPQSVVNGINAAQREAADGMTMFDQHSWSLGVSYAADKNSKIKAEWMMVQTGVVSSLVDAPAGGESGNQRINVLSLSYSFMF